MRASRFGEAAVAASTAMLIVVLVYAIMACRAVFGGGVLTTIGKVSAIGVLYLLASLPAFFIILMWAAIS